MGRLAVKQEGITGPQYTGEFANRHLQMSAQYQAALLGVVAEHGVAGVRARGVSFVEQLQPTCGDSGPPSLAGTRLS